MMLVDDGAGAASVKYSIQRLTVQDNPDHEQRQGLWPAGVSYHGGRPCLGTARDAGFFGGKRAFAASPSGPTTAARSPVRSRTSAWTACATMASCATTGFRCSGLDKTSKIPGLREARASAGERRAHRAQHRPAAVYRQPAPWGSRTAPGSSSRRPTIRAVRRSRSTSSAATSPGLGGRLLHLLHPGTAGKGRHRFRLREPGSGRHLSRSRPRAGAPATRASARTGSSEIPATARPTRR